jgi:vacuolar-type H+-ATPase subunit H
LRSRLQELEDLANQRAGIEQRVRDAKDNDEILPKIMAAGPDAHEELFSQEMKKYESFDEEIKRNEELQRQALKSTKAHRDELVAGFDVEV